MIAVCCKLRSTPVAIRFGLVGVSVDHQHRDTPDADLPYHAGKDRRAPISNCLPGKTGMAEPSLVWIFVTQDPNRNLAVSGDLLACVRTPVRSGLWEPSAFSSPV
jgi:hypothetical protein